jgi:hypothetical protein
MNTLVAATVPDASVPTANTRSPTFTSADDGEVFPGSSKVVVEDRSTITVVLCRSVRVNELVPTDATVPPAPGCAPWWPK